MDSNELKLQIISFFENIETYYGCKTEIFEGLISDIDYFDPKHSTWNLSEFDLIRSAYRNEGNRFMMEGNKMYYEISAERIVSFEKKDANRFEFIEKYGSNVFRITKIKFVVQ